MRLPVLLARGLNPGPRLVATACVHGDEYEGVRAIFDFFEELDPMRMQGDFLGVPVVNEAAFWAVSRTSAIDGLNLARVFPGDPGGKPSQALAWHLDQFVIARADLYIDLHSAGVRCLMPSMVGYWAQDARAREAAMAFGAKVLWSHPNISPGRTISAACDRGIPALYTEARGAGRIDPDDLSLFTRGLRNLVKYLHILDGAPDGVPCELHLHGDGNIDESLAAGRDGFLIPKVELLEGVEAGRELGVLVNTLGEVTERYTAPAAGRVGLIHACPLVRANEPVFLVTGELR